MANGIRVISSMVDQQARENTTTMTSLCMLETLTMDDLMDKVHSHTKMEMSFRANLLRERRSMENSIGLMALYM